MTATFVPAKSLTVAWINASTLVGKGAVLRGGAHLHEPRSPGVGAYAVVSVIASSDDPGEANLHTARMSVTVRSSQHGAAEAAAVAYANLLRSVEDGAEVSLTGAVLRDVARISGPVEVPDPVEAYLIDADLVFQPTES